MTFWGKEKVYVYKPDASALGEALGHPVFLLGFGCQKGAAAGTVLEMDIRYPITAKAPNILEQLGKEAGKYGVSIRSYEDNGPSYMDKNTPFVTCLSEAYAEVMEDGKTPYVMGGGTYARKIPNAVGFGPGIAFDWEEAGFPKGHGNCHSADEAQSITNLKTAVKIYVKALQKLNDL